MLIRFQCLKLTERSADTVTVGHIRGHGKQRSGENPLSQVREPPVRCRGRSPVSRSDGQRHPVYFSVYSMTEMPILSHKITKTASTPYWTTPADSKHRTFRHDFDGRNYEPGSKHHWPRAGSRIVRIDLLHFLGGCCARRLN